MHYFSIRHLTTFQYSAPVSESVMEARMHPRTDQAQRCLTFALSVSPRCRVFSYRDHLGNHIHHFDVPGKHSQLVLIAETLLEMQPMPAVPASLDARAWQDLDEQIAQGDYGEMLLPSEFAKPTPMLMELAKKLDVRRRDDPLSLVRQINDALASTLDYVPKSTRVDSPIDVALEKRQGVCQDFAHIMIALVRHVGIPCRYVSGYLNHAQEDSDIRSTPAATHAWAEAFFPEYGWLGFDPANNIFAADNHIRTAIGRDYADVPPTRGVYRGDASGELEVEVEVASFATLPPFDRETPIPDEWSRLVERAQIAQNEVPINHHAQHMQQQ